MTAPFPRRVGRVRPASPMPWTFSNMVQLYLVLFQYFRRRQGDSNASRSGPGPLTSSMKAGVPRLSSLQHNKLVAPEAASKAQHQAEDAASKTAEARRPRFRGSTLRLWPTPAG
jgi:hypothetical protein